MTAWRTEQTLNLVDRLVKPSPLALGELVTAIAHAVEDLGEVTDRAEHLAGEKRQ